MTTSLKQVSSSLCRLLSIFAVLALPVLALPAAAANFTIGMNSDPDVLDPAQGGSVAGRVVFAAMCDKLVDVTPDGGFQPQLATNWTWSDDNLSLTLTLRPGVLFHDGTSMDAEAVKANLDRYRTNPISRRKNELKSIDTVEVVDQLTVRIVLSKPYAPLVAALSDRSGMMVSPTAVAAVGDDIGLAPVCAGPFAFVERIAQDHITVQKFPDYWDADNVFLDTVTYRIIPDSTVRLFGLRSGDLDMIERVSPTDISAINADPAITLIDGPSIAYDQLNININSGPAGDNPLGNSALVRRALNLAIDRDVINQVVYDGHFVPGNQHELNGTPYWDASSPAMPRDIDQAKALLAEAGVPNPSFTLMASNNPTSTRLAEIIQAMAAEAGFDIKIQALSPASWVAAAKAGEYEAAIPIWSGRPDPDANLTPWTACTGFLNWGKWCDPEYDALLDKARQITDVAERKALYDQANAIFLEAMPQIILYHFKSFWATGADVSGFVPYADGLIRLKGIKTGD